MAYYDNILNLISLVLALSILFIILFGCQFQKYRYIEKFTDATEPATKTTPPTTEPATPPTTEPATKTTPPTTEPATPPATEPATKTETATCGSVTSLKPFEVDLIKKINTNELSTDDIQKMIDSGTFTRENLDNMIAYIQQCNKNMK